MIEARKECANSDEVLVVDTFDIPKGAALILRCDKRLL